MISGIAAAIDCRRRRCGRRPRGSGRRRRASRGRRGTRRRGGGVRRPRPRPRRSQPRLEELADERVDIAVASAVHATAGSSKVSRSAAAVSRATSGARVRYDRRELGRDDLQDRRPHQESLQLVRQVADDLLGEVVVQLLVRAGQPRTNRRISAGDRSRRAAWTSWSDAAQPSVRATTSARTSGSSSRP